MAATIIVELEGIMVLTFPPPSTGGSSRRSRCLIHVPRTDNHHTFRIHDGIAPHDIVGSSSLKVTGGEVTLTPEFRNFSVDIKSEGGGTITYQPAYRPLHTLEIFDGRFTHHSGRLVNSDLMIGGASRPKVVAESKLVTFQLGSGQELVFTNGAFRKSWANNTRIKISNVCDTANPLCDSSDDFSFYYSQVFDVPEHKRLHPMRLPHVVELSSLNLPEFQEGATALTVRLPCWDVVLDEPPPLP